MRGARGVNVRAQGARGVRGTGMSMVQGCEEYNGARGTRL